MCSFTCFKIFFSFISITAFAFFQWRTANFPKPVIDFKHFNPETAPYDDYCIRPFKINIPESDLIELKDKLSTTRELLPSVNGTGFSYGTNSEYLKKFLDYWKTEYNWKEREPYLNQFPQFTTQIAGLKIHFIRVKPDKCAAKGKEIIPLLLIHGWPSSVISLYKIIPLLTTPQKSYDFVFEVVAPSTPGNGFSEASPISGLDAGQIGSIFHRLMFRLGLEKYYIHAADAGAFIGQTQSNLFPEQILGYHSNICLGVSYTSLWAFNLASMVPSILVEGPKADSSNELIENSFGEAAFFHLIVNNPDTVGIGLTDSPVALASTFLDVFSIWTNYQMKNRSDGGLEQFDKNELIDIMMTYWLTKSITPSMRLWRDSLLVKDSQFMRKSLLMRGTTVPSGCVWFKNEMAFTPSISLLFTFSSLLWVSYQDVGGHFPAFHHPHLLAHDIYGFVNKAKIEELNKNPWDSYLRYLNIFVLYAKLFGSTL